MTKMMASSDLKRLVQKQGIPTVDDRFLTEATGTHSSLVFYP